MRFPDNYFRELNPADIISKVSTITLAEISRLGTDELIRIGWLNNPVIDILYSMTSAGVWVAKTDSSGQQKVVEASSSANKYNNQYTQSRPLVGVSPANYTQQANAQPRYALIEFTSNAGGTLDADVDIVPALSGHYGVFKILAYWSEDSGAVTPSFVIQGSGALVTIAGNITANWTPVTNLENLAWWNGTDNDLLFLDTTTSGLGNTKNHRFLIEYWYET
jgi:hypothetical protein